jgi:hypothetical protein
MTRTFQIAVIVLVVAFCFGQLALAADVPHHWGVRLIKHHGPKGNAIRPDVGAAPAANLYNVTSAFVATPTGLSGNLADGYDLWPCAGGAATPGTAVQDENCFYIGSTGTADPASFGGSWVLGSPSYVWYLAADTTDAPFQPFGCAATSSADATNYCGQTNTWYEDWTNDSADNLTYLIEATGTATTDIIADSGTVDFGPNSYAGSSPADIDVVIYGDQNFGTDGASGANNGNCTADYNYPIPAAQIGVVSSTLGITEAGATVTVNISATNNATDYAVGDYVLITGAGAGAYEGAVVPITSVTGSPNTKFTFTAPTGIGNVIPAANTAWAVLYEDTSDNVYYPKIIQAGKTCVNPTPGAAKLSATTEVGTPKLTRSTSASVCGAGGVSEPCYTETFTKKWSVAQSFSIFFR